MSDKKKETVAKKNTTTTKKKVSKLSFGDVHSSLMKGKKIRRTVWPEGNVIFLADAPTEASNFRRTEKGKKNVQEIFLSSESRPMSIYRKLTGDLLATDWEVVK